MFKKILIANRGEIAVRILRACREMGISPVSVYSEADRGALHVRMADEAYPIGPSPSTRSYLSIENILDAARRSRVDAVHPGYGFLSENAAFAQACEDAGLTFIGPSPKSIALMGSKLESRKAVAKYGVPMTPGSVDPLRDADEARHAANSIGYPIMLKASAGGGGKGMRLVRSEAEIATALQTTRAEAHASFGDDAVYMEKVIDRARHIEIQLLADRQGNAIYLGERECTIQRRHQKLIEECPSPIVDEGLRQRLGEAALRVARAADYYNAGTVEFLMDHEGKFYFLEMNTRLQVEHAVTELATGIDLVKEQIRIAAGAALQLRQENITLRGAAVECRIYAEDPSNNFFPSPGTIRLLRQPAGPGVRDDSGVYEGWTVPVDYDPLISKLVVWAPTRDEAIHRMLRALNEYQVEGIQTNLSFFRRLLEHPNFRSGDFDTSFLDRWLQEERPAGDIPVFDQDLAAIAAVLADSAQGPATDKGAALSSQWKMAARLRGVGR